MKHLNNLEWIQEATLLFSAAPRATLFTHVLYSPNFPHVPYLIGDETWGGAEHNNAEGARCSRCLTIRGLLFRTFAFYSFTYLPLHLEAWSAFTAQKLQCFQSYPTCLYSYAWFCLFVKQVGTRTHRYWANVSVGAKNSFAMDCQVIFSNWSKDLCCWHNFLFCFVELLPRFTATPLDPFYVLEGNNATFVWQYNLSGTFDRVVFQFSSSTPSRAIVIKPALNTEARVSNTFYQGRIQENINATRAEITIFALQRSESGQYEIQVTDSTFSLANYKMTVQVQCK